MRVHHIALRTADVDRLRRFYGEVLGLAASERRAAPADARRDPRDPRDEQRTWLEADGVVLMLERAEPGEPAVAPGTRDLVAFAVDDREAWRARLLAAGVVVEAETAYTLYFRDPDGRRVAVSAHPLD